MRAGGLAPATRGPVLGQAQGLLARSMRAGGLAPATLLVVRGCLHVNSRSMRAGGLAPATHDMKKLRSVTKHAFNEGRGVSPGDTPRGAARAVRRRLRSMRAGGLAPATPGHQAPSERPRCPAFNEGRGVSPGDTRRCFAEMLSRSPTFNEGRGVSPGDTSDRWDAPDGQVARSMRAGGLAPATLEPSRVDQLPIDPRSMRAGGLAPATRQLQTRLSITTDHVQ